MIMTQKKTKQLTIIEEIDGLKEKYEDLFRTTEDIKALQGVERCLEMKIKSELNSKSDGDALKTETNKEISLSELPTSLLEELLSIINEKNMKQQQI